MFRISIFLLIASICIPAAAEEQTVPPEVSQARNDEIPEANRFVSCKCAFLGKNDDGKIEAAVIVYNKSAETAWVPRMYESKNILFQSGHTLQDLHCDGGLCRFPNSYFKLAANKYHVYIFELPWNKVERGSYSFQIWAPWRDRKENDKNIPIEENIRAEFNMNEFLELQGREDD